MTNLITLTIPNDDHVALRAFGKALEEMALAHGAEPQAETLVRQRAGDLEVEYLTRDVVAERLRVATEDLQQAAPRMMQELRCEGDELQGKRKEPEVDTTAQQVESLVERVNEMLEVAEQPFMGETVPSTDSTGTPWDERIHSASKALNADGSWRLRRKPKDMDEVEWAALVESVKVELMHGDAIREAMDKAERGDAVYYNSEEAEQKMDGFKESLRQEPPVTPPGDDFHTDAGVVTEQTVAGIPPIPVPPPVALPGSTGATDLLPPAPIPTAVTPINIGNEAWDFPKLMKFLTERHGKIDVPTVNQLLAVDGLAALTDLNAHPDKIGPFVARVKAHLGE